MFAPSWKNFSKASPGSPYLCCRFDPQDEPCPPASLPAIEVSGPGGRFPHPVRSSASTVLQGRLTRRNMHSHRPDSQPWLPCCGCPAPADSRWVRPWMLQACLSSTRLKLLVSIAAPIGSHRWEGPLLPWPPQCPPTWFPVIQRYCELHPKDGPAIPFLGIWKYKHFSLFIWLCQVLVVACRIQFPQPRIETGPPVLGAGAPPTGEPGKPWCKHFLRLWMLTLNPTLRPIFFKSKLTNGIKFFYSITECFPIYFQHKAVEEIWNWRRPMHWSLSWLCLRGSQYLDNIKDYLS